MAGPGRGAGQDQAGLWQDGGGGAGDGPASRGVCGRGTYGGGHRAGLHPSRWGAWVPGPGSQGRPTPARCARGGFTCRERTCAEGCVSQSPWARSGGHKGALRAGSSGCGGAGRPGVGQGGSRTLPLRTACSAQRLGVCVGGAGCPQGGREPRGATQHLICGWSELRCAASL